jgi:DNA helicase II / ATP-dependent DNA helicase PcrA
MVVQRRLKPQRARVKQLNFIDVHALYRQLFANDSWLTQLSGSDGTPQGWAAICKQTVEKLDQTKLAYEDATPYLYLSELVLGLHANTSIRHVLVDEAQDYSPFQLEFLKRLFPRAKMTALGDLNQGIYAHQSALSDGAMSNLYGADQTETILLTRSYRSTREIVEFTRGMVLEGDRIEPFNRSGDTPEVTIVDNRGQLNDSVAADIKSLHADGFQSIAVICKTAEETAEAFASLRDRISLRLVEKSTLTFEKEALVIPAYLAKGVEFDAVILYDGSAKQYNHEHERKLFYTACTRAMHLLHIYSLGEPSRFITTQQPDTYSLKTPNAHSE